MNFYYRAPYDTAGSPYNSNKVYDNHYCSGCPQCRPDLYPRCPLPTLIAPLLPQWWTITTTETETLEERAKKMEEFLKTIGLKQSPKIDGTGTTITPTQETRDQQTPERHQECAFCGHRFLSHSRSSPHECEFPDCECVQFEHED